MENPGDTICSSFCILISQSSCKKWHLQGTPGTEFILLKEGVYDYTKGKNHFWKTNLKIYLWKTELTTAISCLQSRRKKKKKDAGWNILASHKCHRTYRNVIAAILNAVTEASGSRDRKKSLNFTVHLGNAKPHPISIADHSTEKDQANDKFQSVN